MSAQTPRRDASTWTGLLGFWCALWLVVGVWVGYEVWQLSELAATVAESGRALGAAGSALQSLGNIPLVGDTTSELGQRVSNNGANIVQSSGAAEGSIRRLSVLLGLTVSLIPSVPVIVVHRTLSRGRPLVAEG